MNNRSEFPPDLQEGRLQHKLLPMESNSGILADSECFGAAGALAFDSSFGYYFPILP